MLSNSRFCLAPLIPHQVTRKYSTHDFGKVLHFNEVQLRRNIKHSLIVQRASDNCLIILEFSIKSNTTIIFARHASEL